MESNMLPESANFQKRIAFTLDKHPSYTIVFLAGFPVLFSAITYLIVVPLLSLSNLPGLKYAVSILSERGFIPYIIVFFFWVMISLLVLSYLKIRFEEYAFGVVRNQLKLQDSMVYTDSKKIIKDLGKEPFQQFENSLIVRRLKQGMQRLFNTQETNALTEYFKQRSEIEYSEMDSSFSTIKYFNWLIPTLGFIGTVLGIGIGIAGFATLIQSAQNFDEIKEYLPQVTVSLGVAFDTTFLALILSVVGMFLTSSISKKYSNLLEEIDAYCLDDISSRFKIHSTTAEELKEVLREVKDEIGNLLNVNRIETSNLLEAHFSNLHKILNNLPLPQTDLRPVIVYLKKIQDVLKNDSPEAENNQSTTEK